MSKHRPREVQYCQQHVKNVLGTIFLHVFDNIEPPQDDFLTISRGFSEVVDLGYFYIFTVAHICMMDYGFINILECTLVLWLKYSIVATNTNSSKCIIIQSSVMCNGFINLHFQ